MSSAQETRVQVPLCAVVLSYFYMNCNVKYKCDFSAHHSGCPGGALQVIRSVVQGSSPGKGHPRGFLLCIVMSNTSVTSLQVLAGHLGGMMEGAVVYCSD